MGKTISNPKIFTLDNQSATVTQGEEIPYQTTSDGTTSTSFKEAALKLEVTPSIIGDGNVLLTFKLIMTLQIDLQVEMSHQLIKWKL